MPMHCWNAASWRSTIGLFLVLDLLLVIMAAPTAGATISKTPSLAEVANAMQVARQRHTATTLPDGTIFVTGGRGSAVGSLASVEIYDPISGRWRLIPNMSEARFDHTATLLSNGTVLVVGGRSGEFRSGRSLASAEIYDPASDTWRPAAPLATAREFHTATRLADGRVLVIGGRRQVSTTWSALASAEIYDPARNEWRSAGTMAVPRSGHTATLLTTGDVLVAGGGSDRQILAAAELYRAATSTWQPTGSLTEARTWHTATLLADGSVLAAAGYDGSLWIQAAERYDPATGSWSSAGMMEQARAFHTATRLDDGRTIVIGGEFSLFGAYFSSTEIFDPIGGSWTAGPSLCTGRSFHTATVLPDGSVLVAGGGNLSNELASVERVRLGTPGGCFRLSLPLLAA